MYLAEERNCVIMNENHTKVTKQETLGALRNPGELYVVMSGATRLPFIACDKETFDDEVYLFYRLEDAKEKAKKLLGEKYITAVAKLENKQLLQFYTSLYTMGVNCLAVNSGTDMEICVQLSELVTRKPPEEGKKLIENPAFHLTAIYFIQELRRGSGMQNQETLKELQEEMLAHYSKGTFIIAVQEDGQLPVLKQKDGSMYQPVFSDFLELQKFAKGKKMKTAVIPAGKISEILIPDAKGIVVNPFGVNIQLNVEKKTQNVKS